MTSVWIAEVGMARRRRGLYGFKTFSERGAWVEMAGGPSLLIFRYWHDGGCPILAFFARVGTTDVETVRVWGRAAHPFAQNAKGWGTLGANTVKINPESADFRKWGEILSRG
jgi:hypothetical protein